VALAAGVSAAEVDARLSGEGARSFVRQTTRADPKRWEAILAQINTGQADWIGVAAKLLPGVDAASGEDLTGALAGALRRNPQAVLPLTGPALPLKDVCNVPLIEPTDAQVAQWKRQVIAALDRVHEPTLTDKVKACRAAIKAVQ
jgi:hypothetical protein